MLRKIRKIQYKIWAVFYKNRYRASIIERESTSLLCTLLTKFDKNCHDAVQLSKSKKKAWQDGLYMIWYKSSLRERQTNRELKSLRDTSKKEFEKKLKKYLTNSKRCDIINKLSRKRGLTQKKAFEWNGILKIEQWTTKRNPWKFRAELE